MLGSSYLSLQRSICFSNPFHPIGIFSIQGSRRKNLDLIGTGFYSLFKSLKNFVSLLAELPFVLHRHIDDFGNPLLQVVGYPRQDGRSFVPESPLETQDHHGSIDFYIIHAPSDPDTTILCCVSK